MDRNGWKSFFNRGNFKLGLRHWIGTLIVAIVAGFVIFGFLRGQEFLASLLADRETNRVIKELEKPYREDKYGGKTPEETFDLFLEALRKGDIELASKYFELENQGRWSDKLNEYRESGILDDFLLDYEETRQEWVLSSNDGLRAEYNYTEIISKNTKTKIGNQIIEIPAGTYVNSVVFIKSLSRVWKISEL